MQKQALLSTVYQPQNICAFVLVILWCFEYTKKNCFQLFQQKFSMHFKNIVNAPVLKEICAQQVMK